MNIMNNKGKNNKGKKTTLVAVLGTILIMLTFVMWWLGKIDTTELQSAITAVVGAMTAIGLWFAKDASSSHTFDLSATTGDHPDPKKEEK